MAMPRAARWKSVAGLADEQCNGMLIGSASGAANRDRLRLPRSAALSVPRPPRSGRVTPVSYWPCVIFSESRSACTRPFNTACSASSPRSSKNASARAACSVKRSFSRSAALTWGRVLVLSGWCYGYGPQRSGSQVISSGACHKVLCSPWFVNTVGSRCTSQSQCRRRRSCRPCRRFPKPRSGCAGWTRSESG